MAQHIFINRNTPNELVKIYFLIHLKLFAYWVILRAFWLSADFFSFFFLNSFRNTIRVSNTLIPDQNWTTLVVVGKE